MDQFYDMDYSIMTPVTIVGIQFKTRLDTKVGQKNLSKRPSTVLITCCPREGPNVCAAYRENVHPLRTVHFAVLFSLVTVYTWILCTYLHMTLPQNETWWCANFNMSCQLDNGWTDNTWIWDSFLFSILQENTLFEYELAIFRDIIKWVDYL
jgi:hypothetical protein